MGSAFFTVSQPEYFSGKLNKGSQFSPPLENPPQCSQDPCGDPSHSLRLNSDPPLAKRQNDPRPPLRRGPSHLQGNISKSSTWNLCFFPTNWRLNQTSPGYSRRSSCNREHTNVCNLIFTFKFIFLQRFYFELKTFIFTRPRHSLPLAGRAHRLFSPDLQAAVSQLLFIPADEEKERILFYSDPAWVLLPQTNQQAAPWDPEQSTHRSKSLQARNE